MDSAGVKGAYSCTSRNGLSKFRKVRYGYPIVTFEMISEIFEKCGWGTTLQKWWNGKGWETNNATKVQGTAETERGLRVLVTPEARLGS